MRLQILNRIAAMSKSNGWFTQRTMYKTKAPQYIHKNEDKNQNINAEIIYFVINTQNSIPWRHGKTCEILKILLKLFLCHKKEGD